MILQAVGINDRFIKTRKLGRKLLDSGQAGLRICEILDQRRKRAVYGRRRGQSDFGGGYCRPRRCKTGRQGGVVTFRRGHEGGVACSLIRVAGAINDGLVKARQQGDPLFDLCQRSLGAGHVIGQIQNIVDHDGGLREQVVARAQLLLQHHHGKVGLRLFHGHPLAALGIARDAERPLGARHIKRGILNGETDRRVAIKTDIQRLGATEEGQVDRLVRIRQLGGPFGRRTCLGDGKRDTAIRPGGDARGSVRRKGDADIGLDEKLCIATQHLVEGCRIRLGGVGGDPQQNRQFLFA